MADTAPHTYVCLKQSFNLPCRHFILYMHTGRGGSVDIATVHIASNANFCDFIADKTIVSIKFHIKNTVSVSICV